MAFQTLDINELDPQIEPLYFCDANVWIAALKFYGIGDPAKEEKPYIDFVEAVVNLNELKDPEALKRIKNKPKFVITSMLLSEIINAFMRKVAMKTYFADKFTKGLDFKSAYRDNPVSDYNKQLNNLVTDIIAFKDYTILMDDNFCSLSPFEFIAELDSKMDFNDRYYFEFLKSKNIPFVTHDKDCHFDGVKVITSQVKLLHKRKY
jgi:hypothetical protein